MIHSPCTHLMCTHKFVVLSPLYYGKIVNKGNFKGIRIKSVKIK